ncbi:MAG: nuclear transport factor 2 family protein [Acidobacteria bacterium]|nr:nuclear transport factor 2 family protein [Acidobacteriota bacterium]
MKWILGSILVLACAMVADAQAPVRDAKAEKSMLIALENAWNQAQIHRDGEALSRLIADKFVYTDWDGTLLNKAQFITGSKDPSVDTTLVANNDVDVHFYPGFAIVTGAYHAKGTNRGKPFDHYGRFTDTWISSDGQWQCVASHTNLTKKPAAR